MPRVTMDISYPPAWCQAARYAGHRQVKTWVYELVETFLRIGPGRFYPISPLTWKRGTFQAIRTVDGTTYALHEVKGVISGPFGVYQGIYLVRHRDGYTLTHIPTGRKLATLNRAGECKRLAGELVGFRMNWHETDPEKVAGADAKRVNALVSRYEQAALPVRSDAYAGVGRRR
jgi:hypothetical protein